MNQQPAADLTDMKINSQFIRSHPLLSLIPYFSARKLISESAFSEYPKGTVIFHQGDPCDAIYLIVSGRCESRRGDGNGGEEIEEVSGPGDTLGDSEFLNQEPYRSTVKVVTDSIMLRLSGAVLQELFKKKPSFAGRFSQTITDRLKLHRKARDGYPSRVRRVVSLISLGSRSDDGIVARQLAAAPARYFRERRAAGEPRTDAGKRGAEGLGGGRGKIERALLLQGKSPTK